MNDIIVSKRIHNPLFLSKAKIVGLLISKTCAETIRTPYITGIFEFLSGCSTLTTSSHSPPGGLSTHDTKKRVN